MRANMESCSIWLIASASSRRSVYAQCHQLRRGVRWTPGSVDARFYGRLALWTSGGTNVAAFFRGAYQTQVGLASSSSEIFRAMA